MLTIFWDVVQGVFGICIMAVVITGALYLIHYIIRHWNDKP